MEKKQLRAEVRRLKQLHDTAELQRMSRAVCQRVADSPEWAAARRVLLYHPLPDEVDVRPLLSAALAEGKSVLLPRVVGDDLEVCLYTGEESLRIGAFGIEEPTGERIQELTDIDLVVVPGMAFDAQGHRLGRGRGYYDRLLPQLPHAVRIGVCFPFQLMPVVPACTHDAHMHLVMCT